jgi:hypothetical protein
MGKFRMVAFLVFASGFGLVTTSSAQPLGSFRWQLQPYCNIVTLAVVQQGGQYQLDGTDDQCGAAQAASVRGMAFQNLNGTIGFGLTVVTAPGGTPVHIDATITFPGLNGTWRDSAGNAGNFIFGAGIPGGSPRLVLPGGLAPASVTTIQIAPGAVTNTQIAANAVTGANIVNGSVTLADLVAAPALAGAPSTATATALDGSDQIIRTVTLNIPSSGTVVANATGLIGLDSSGSDGAWCSITTGTVVDEASFLVVIEYEGTSIRWMSLGGSRFFNVTAGTFTIRLVCTGLAGSTRILSPALSALFIPGQ